MFLLNNFVMYINRKSKKPCIKINKCCCHSALLIYHLQLKGETITFCSDKDNNTWVWISLSLSVCCECEHYFMSTKHIWLSFFKSRKEFIKVQRGKEQYLPSIASCTKSFKYDLTVWILTQDESQSIRKSMHRNWR